MRLLLALLLLSVVVVAEDWPEKTHFELPLTRNHDLGYYVELGFGTPPQPVTLQIDTKTNLPWATPDCSKSPPESRDFCIHTGTYDPDKSKTYWTDAFEQEITFGPEAQVTCDLGRDTVSITKDVTMKYILTGKATESTGLSAGVLGLGHRKENMVKWPARQWTFLDQLRHQNFIRTMAYSLALGSLDKNDSVIVFGGLDTSKFTGPLSWLPIIKNSADTAAADGVLQYTIPLDSLSISSSGTTTRIWTDKAIPALIDTMSPVTVLPYSIVNEIALDLGATTREYDGVFAVDCDRRSTNKTLHFEFDGATVKVPYKDLVREGPEGCTVGLVGEKTSKNKPHAVLGLTFLRSAYIIFNQKSKAVQIAQYSNCGSTPENIYGKKVKYMKELQGACVT